MKKLILSGCLLWSVAAVLFFDSVGIGDFFVVSRSDLYSVAVLILLAGVLWWGLSWRPIGRAPFILLFFLLVGFVFAVWNSDHLLMSTVGSAERGQGVMIYLVYVLWFVLLLIVMRWG